MRRRSKSQSYQKSRSSELVVIPVEDQRDIYNIPDCPISPIPERRHRSQVVAQIGVYPAIGSGSKGKKCVCDSRRSSDSGLADMVSHMTTCPQYQGSQQSMMSSSTPLSPVLSRKFPQNQTTTPLSPILPRKVLTSQSDYSTIHNSQTFNSNDSLHRKTPNLPQTGNSSQSVSSVSATCSFSESTCPEDYVTNSNLQTTAMIHATQSARDLVHSESTAPVVSSRALSMDDLQLVSPPASNLTDGNHNNIAFSSSSVNTSGLSSPNWNRTKEIYKTGLYAHWWLNASLQPITEECTSDKLSENL